jgi:hypothetical protein
MTDLTAIQTTPATTPAKEVGEATGPGTAKAAQEQLAKANQQPSLLNDETVDLNDETSDRTIEGDKGDQTPVVAGAFDPAALKLDPQIDKKNPAFNEFAEISKKSGVKQEVAQEYIDLYAKTVKEAADRPYQMWRDTQKGWQNEVMSDQELGGKNFDEVRRVIGSALHEYGDPGVKTALDFTGAGNNPAIIRTLFRMSKALAEPGRVTGNTPNSTKPDSPGAALYPHLVQNRAGS